MNQRFLMAAICLLVATSLGSMALAWQSLAASRALAEKVQSANADLLKELRSIVERQPVAPVVAPVSTQPREWNQLLIRCVSETPGGKPLEGISVTCADAEPSSRLPPKTVVTDKQGLAEIGQVLYGQYVLTVSIADKLKRSYKISVYPGQDRKEVIVCPPPNAVVQVPLQLKPPEVHLTEAMKKRFWYQFRIQSLSHEAGENWLVQPNKTQLTIAIDPDGRMWRFGDANTPLAEQYYEQPWQGANVETVPRPADASLAEFALGRLTLSSTAQPMERFELPLGAYQVRFDGVAVVDDRDPTERAFFIFSEQPAFRPLPLGIVRPGRSEPYEPTDKEKGIRFVTWPSTETWILEAPRKKLDLVEFLVNTPEGSSSVAISPASHVLPTDRLDILLDREVVLANVPLFGRRVQFTSQGVLTYAILCHLTKEELQKFREVSKPNRGLYSSSGPRLKYQIHPAGEEDKRGTLPADFEDRLKPVLPPRVKPGEKAE